MTIEYRNSNGNIKWWHFITVILGIITIVVTVTICVTGQLAAAIERNEAKIMDNKNCFHSIDNRLARIEERLDVLDIRK